MSFDNRHKIARPYWARPGFSTFAKADDGGGKDDDLNDDDDDDDDEDDEDDPDEGKTEDELRAELKATRESLSKASGSGKSKRDKIKSLERELAAAKAGKPVVKGKPDADDKVEVDADAIRAEAKAEALAEAKRDRIADKAENALARANVVPAKLKRAVKLLDLDDLDLNADGSLDGFDEQLESLRADMPELFTKTRKRESVAGENDRDGKSKSKSPLSTSEIQARQLTGKR
jgi:hypothetical protein